MAQEAFLDQRLQEVDIGVSHLLSRSKRAAARENRQSPEQLLLFRHKKVVRPLDRCPQGLLARLGVAAALEQIEALREPLEDLGGREDPRPGGGELDGQRKVVEPPAKLLDRLVELEPGALAEQVDGFAIRQRRHLVLDLAPDTQELAARDEKLQIGTSLDE